MKNLKKVADRIIKAIRTKEKIILYGDTDLDGTASVIILEEAIKTLGGKVTKIYFPNRETEGYGLNKKALRYLKPLAPALLITLDCGIGNFEQVKIAKKIGFEVIVIDHHEVLNDVPEASLVVDPKQKGDNYPSKELANTGIVFNLSQVLLKDKLKGLIKNNFLELTALATLADMMPQTGENKVLTDEGLSVLPETLRPGLKVFLKLEGIKKPSLRNVTSRIISVLNMAGTKNHLTDSYLLLNSSTEKEAKKILDKLLERSEERYEQIKEITFKVQDKVLKDFKSPIVFEGDEGWPLAFAGSVASRICRDFQKPVFIFKKGKTQSRGAVRVPKSLNSVKAMETCADLLITFGGHPLASGFTAKNENLEKFKECLTNYFRKKL